MFDSECECGNNCPLCENCELHECECICSKKFDEDEDMDTEW